MLDKRVISALVALPLLFGAVIINKYVFFGALCLVTALALYEYFMAAGIGSIKPMSFAGIVLGIVMLFLIFIDPSFDFLVPFITLTVVITLAIPVFMRKYNVWSTGVTILGILYIPTFFGYLYLIRAIPQIGVYLIWFVFIISWISDTMAYFSGKAFGKTKLCPAVSPKKTVEGSIGGMLGSTVGCVVYGLFLKSFGIIDIPVLSLAFIGILGSIVSQIGDLSASSIKRNVGIKDYGKIMPGHGGVLDRFDSILFVAPLIYYYINYFLQ